MILTPLALPLPGPSKMGFLAVNEYITEIDLSSMLSKRSTLGALALPLLAALCCGPVRAAELGEVKVNSFLGQQLSADIELVDLTAADLAEIQARLANPDVFKGAGLNMPPVLGGMYISVAKRDNRRFLHLTTLQPVNNEALHLFLELSSGGRQIIRAATLWLTPEPPTQRAARTAAAQAAAPAALPMPAASPMSALAPAAQPASSAPTASAGPDATLAGQAASTPPAVTGTVPKPSPSAGAKRAVEPGEAGLSLAAERAFAARKQAAATSAAARTEGGPAGAAVAPAQAQAPKPAAKPARAAPAVAPAKEVAAGPAMPASVQATAPACVPAQVEAQIQQCQAMTGKLVDLEGKVQRLQQALAPATMPALAPPSASMAKAGAGPASGPAPDSAKSNAPATDSAPIPAAAPAQAQAKAQGPAPAAAAAAAAPTKPGAKPAKPGVSGELEAKSRTSTIMMAAAGAVILAALGGLFYFLRKRKGQGPLKIWQSFRKKEEPAVAEPVMEEATAQE